MKRDKLWNITIDKSINGQATFEKRQMHFKLHKVINRKSNHQLNISADQAYANYKKRRIESSNTIILTRGKL